MANGNGSDQLYTLTGAQLRSYSDLLRRHNFATRHGLTFPKSTASGWFRDLYQALGYNRDPQPPDYRHRYERGGIAERIVEALPKATWRGGGDVIEDEDPDTETTFEAAWRSLDERLDVWAALMRADILAGLGRYSVLLIGADGNLASDLSFSPRDPDGVLYLSAYSEEDAEVAKVEDDEASPRFGLPVEYQVSIGTLPSARKVGASTETKKVHWSRIIHIADGAIRDGVYGKPRLRAVYNYLDDLEKIHGAGAEAFWQRADPITQFDLPEDAELDPAQEDDLDDEIDELRHGLRRVVRTQGMAIKQHRADTSAFGSNIDSLIGLISATTGIPKRILMGSERGELASTQDRANWHERVAIRRMEFAAGVVSDLVDRLVEYGALPGPVEPYQVSWPEIENLDESEKAELADKLASVNEKQFRAGQGAVFSVSEIREVTGRAPADEIEDLRAAAESFDNVESPPDEPSWKAVHRAADEQRDAVAAVFAAALAEAREEFDVDAMRAAISRGDRPAARQVSREAVAALAVHRDPIARALFDALVAGGNAASRSAEARGGFLRTAQVEMAFDQTNPEALLWAERRAGELIAEETAGVSIADQTLEALRETVAAMFDEGIPPAKAARQVREVVGLTTPQATAVRNLRSELASAQAGDLIERFPPREGMREVSGFRAKVPPGGPTDEWVERAVSRYTRMQHNLRARIIARTETITAAREGQQQLWSQAQGRGLLSATQERRWIDTGDGRTCPECQAMAGQTAKLGEPYDNGVMGPTLHPGCRCAEGLVAPAPGERRAASLWQRATRRVREAVHA